MASATSSIPGPGISAGGGPPRVHTVTEDIIHGIPEENALFFANKVVIGFEEEFTIYRAKSWLRSYKPSHLRKIEIFHELPNALFVVQFDAEDLPAAKSLLLASSPISLGDLYASVNDYNIAFDPCNQRDFRHLVTVNIPWGNPAIFSLIKCFTRIVGSYVKGVLGPDLRHISVIVESTLKLFPAFNCQARRLPQLASTTKGAICAVLTASHTDISRLVARSLVRRSLILLLSSWISYLL